MADEVIRRYMVWTSNVKGCIYIGAIDGILNLILITLEALTMWTDLAPALGSELSKGGGIWVGCVIGLAYYGLGLCFSILLVLGALCRNCTMLKIWSFCNICDLFLSPVGLIAGFTSKGMVLGSVSLIGINVWAQFLGYGAMQEVNRTPISPPSYELACRRYN